MAEFTIMESSRPELEEQGPWAASAEAEKRGNAWLSRSISSLRFKERQIGIARAHIIDCECGTTFLLRQGSCSECPACEKGHTMTEEFDNRDQDTVPKFKGKIDWTMTRKYYGSQIGIVSPMYFECSSTAEVSWEGGPNFSEWGAVLKNAVDVVNSRAYISPEAVEFCVAPGTRSVTINFWASPLHSVSEGR